MSNSDDGFLRTWHRGMGPAAGVAQPKAVGAPLTAIGVSAWAKITDAPDAYYAQLTGTSGAITATCHFEFGDDIPGLPMGLQTSVAPAGVGTTIALTGTGTGVPSGSAPASSVYVGIGQFNADASVSPLVPWKYVRLAVTAISGTGAQVAGFQSMGGV
jgi:hypothetical protein